MRPTQFGAPIAQSGTDVWLSIDHVTQPECAHNVRSIIQRKRGTSGRKRHVSASCGTTTLAWMGRCMISQSGRDANEKI